MQQRFVSIWLPHLATDWFAAKQPALRQTVFVLKAPAQGRLVVTACSPAAEQEGIHPGMTLADARALCPRLNALDHRSDLAGQLLQRMAEWCIRFTPLAAPQPPDGLLLDATGCPHLWGGEEPYLKDMEQRLAHRGYTARAAMADTIGAAWAQARYGGGGVVASGAQATALLRLPPAALRLPAPVAERLHKLGLHRIENLLSVPRPALRRRFGAETVQRLAQALGEEAEFFSPVYLPTPHTERLPCLEPIRTRAGIEVALERLLPLICRRLQNEGKGLRCAYFRCYRSNGTAQGIEISTSRASNNETHLGQLFGLKLGTLAPEEGIELFVLEATKVEDYTPAQERLWQTGTGGDDDQLAQLIDRLAGKLGADAVQRFLPAEHHWPERSFRSASPLHELPALAWPTDKRRPLRLLPTPEAIEVTAPIPDYPPLNFRHRGTLHTVARADGPERIEQEWWLQDGEHRDYYCVEDAEGQRYWLFRAGHYTGDRSARWFLHGFFA